MYQYHSYTEEDNKKLYEFEDKQAKGLFLTKVFGMMFLCLAITTVVAAGLGYGLMYLLVNTATTNSDGNLVYDVNIVYTMVGLLIGSAVILMIMSFVLPIMFLRGKHNIIVPLMIYVTVMGVMLSSLTWAFEPVILAEAFGITALIFGIMAFLGFISKGKLTGVWVVAIGLLVGAGLLSFVNFIMIMIGGVSEANVTLSWIVSLAVFGFLMLMTMWDVHRINSIAANGSESGNNLVYYCAYILYSDFIAILIRVLRILAIVARRK